MHELHPHQQRVVDEKKDLDQRLDKLSQFIDSNQIFPTLDEYEQDRLQRQVRAMSDYSEILKERIAAFFVR